MNNSSLFDARVLVDNENAVQKLNDDMARLHIPAIIFVCVLMVLGLTGNGMVVYFYGWKTTKTAYNHFVVVLAVYDIISCAISMPNAIVEIEFYYTYRFDAICKIQTFVNYVASIGSVLTLVVIAIDRFKKIYRPTKSQISMKTARLTTAAVFGISVLLSCPTLFLYGSIIIDIPNTDGHNLQGSDCSTMDTANFHVFLLIFNGLHLLIFIILSVLLIVLYSLLWKTILTHRNKMRSLRQLDKATSTSEQIAHNMPKSECPNAQRHKNEVCLINFRKDMRENSEATRKRLSLERPTEVSIERTTTSMQGLNTESVRITLVMIIITVVFIVSFLPYLTLTIWQDTKGKHEAAFLAGSDLVMFKIGKRSYLLNSSLNPWIYGMFNSVFRHFIADRIKNCLCRRM